MGKGSRWRWRARMVKGERRGVLFKKKKKKKVDVCESRWAGILLRPCFPHAGEFVAPSLCCNSPMLHPPVFPSSSSFYWAEACRWTQTDRLTHISSHDLPDNSLRAHTWVHTDTHAHSHLGEREKKKKTKVGPQDWALRHSNLVTQQQEQRQQSFPSSPAH